jgi:peptidoglycan/LPS O-acetylase OafA/YrhL
VRYAVSTVRVQSKVELSAVSESRDNNFDVLRLFAAGLVLLSHSFALTGRHEPLAPHTLGTVGVEIFFVVSGFLVTRSWLGDPSFRSFIGKPIRRIPRRGEARGSNPHFRSGTIGGDPAMTS